jgi:pimeloyl-ACP methyl ester carboxylesterase
MREALDVSVGVAGLPGVVTIPAAPRGIVIFAHGSGSSRLSPRNVYAATKLQDEGFATLLFDLLTQDESRDRRNVFDVELLSARVIEAIEFIAADARTATLPIGLFGASTGAAAALRAAAERPERVLAVVSRGGRPDLAGAALPIVRAPTLLIVGGDDREVFQLNETARRAMRCEVELVVVPGAGHLFEEPGALDEALLAAGDWFVRHVRGGQ